MVVRCCGRRGRQVLRSLRGRYVGCGRFMVATWAAVASVAAVVRRFGRRGRQVLRSLHGRQALRSLRGRCKLGA